jgi:metal-responsive CopG/Arc/MetJ family transcriptional regulator
MGRTKFGVSIDDDVAERIGEIASSCEDIDANRSDVIDGILTAFVEGNDEPTRRARELIIKKRKGSL